LIVVFALIAAAFAGEQQGARQERQVVAYSSGWPYSGSYVPTAYSAYNAPVAYSAYSSPYYGGVYGGYPAVRAYY
jgi:hypothetical protein